MKAGCPGQPKLKPRATSPLHRQPSSMGTLAHPPPASSAAAIAAAHDKHGGPPARTDTWELEFLAPGHQSPQHPVGERRGRRDSQVPAASPLPPLTGEVAEPRG
jgi:hypothetical protein